MIPSIMKLTRRRVLIDIDTQKDFFIADGTACIRNHRRVLTNIRRIMAWARTSDMHVVSTTLVNKPNGIKHPSCVEGTDGVKKIRYTMLNRRISFDANGYTDLPRDIFKQYQQIILGKRVADPFEEPRAERVLTEIKADEFIVIGAPTETAVKSTVLGLLQRGKKVILVEDAIGSYEKGPAEIALRQMLAKGARLMETKALAGVSHLKRVGICECDRCQGLLEKVIS